MLTSITPLGERGRGQRWWLTVAFFVAASTAAGAATGGALGAAGGWLAGAVGAGARVQLAALALVALVALVVDLSGRRVPGPRRQVNENWLPAFRGWVYGAGFGLQLGIGAATIVTTALVYVAFAGAFVLGSPALGLVIGAVFGAVRGAAILPSAGGRDPAGLQRLNARLERWRGRAARIAIATEALLVMAFAVVAT